MIVPPRLFKEKGEDISTSTRSKVPSGSRPVTLTMADHCRRDRSRLPLPLGSRDAVAELQSGGIDVASLVPISLIETIKSDPKLDVVSVTGRP